ncbi:MAG: TIM-barrel domain-containing protein [Mobilitalea sp.]
MNEVSQTFYENLQVTGCDESNEGICFQTDGQAKLWIKPVSKRSIKVWGDRTGSKKAEKSYSVEKEPLLFTYTLTQEKEYYIIQLEELAVRVYMKGIRLAYYKPDNRTLITYEKQMDYREDGSIFIKHELGEKEHFYGLGEDNDAYLGNLDRRGTTRDMITGQRINIGHVTADIPITFFMSTGQTAPYGMFLDNSYRQLWDMGKKDVTSYEITAEGGELLFYFFAGNNFEEILSEYTAVTGRPELPPLWALGFIQSKCSYYDWDEIDELIEEFDKRQIPLDGVVFDYDWAEYFNNYKWNKRFGGKTHEKIKDYRDKGLHFMVSNSGPMIKKDSDNYGSLIENDLYAKNEKGEPVTCGHFGGDLMDFSHPKMKEWLQPQLNRIMDDGVESWWLDLTEPEGDPDGTKYYDGDKAKVHNPFSLLNTKTYYQISKEYDSTRRPFILTRTGTAGIQKYCASIWSGDVFSDYKTLTAHVPEALNTGMSGIPLWTSDGGGFMSSTSNATDSRNIYKNDTTAHAALYERWLQFACFCPVMRAHHAGESAPYFFNEITADGVAHYIRLRYRLLPYIYSYNYQSYLTGAPIMRPLVYEYPTDENVWNCKDEYLFGKEILVAPVLEEKTDRRDVYLPEGTWYDWDYGYEYEGGKSYEIFAPQNRIPVFIKAGAIIPLAEVRMRTKETDFSKLELLIYPEGTTEFIIYSDDGKTNGYQKEQFTLTNIQVVENRGVQTHITLDKSNSLFPVKESFIQMYVNAIPESVEVNGMQMERSHRKRNLNTMTNGFWYDNFHACLYIKSTLSMEKKDVVLISYQEGSMIRKIKEYGEIEEVNGQLPFLLPAASLPCKLGCENFDRGGEGVAYHKNVPGNENGLYRKDGVNIELCDDVGCGYNVFGLMEGEWLEYSVNARKAGYYYFHLRYRTKGVTNIYFCVNSQNQSGYMVLDSSKWEEICTEKIYLSESEQVIKLYVDKGNLSANWLEIVEVERN